MEEGGKGRAIVVCRVSVLWVVRTSVGIRLADGAQPPSCVYPTAAHSSSGAVA